jgi:hypothetical protein
MVAEVMRAKAKDGMNKAATRQKARTARVTRQDLPSNSRRYFCISTQHKDYVIRAMNGSDQTGTAGESNCYPTHSGHPEDGWCFSEKVAQSDCA